MRFFKNSPRVGMVTVLVGEDRLICPLKITVADKVYEFLGSGNYNVAYKSVAAPYEVYKRLFSEEKTTDLPERAVRIWNEINPSLTARVAGDQKGWIAPFVAGEDANDTDISNAVLDIYIRTGRIIVDASIQGNFKKTRSGATVCVDVGAALQLEARIEKAQSEVSLRFWDKRMQKAYDGLFNALPQSTSKTIRMIKALLYLKLHRPDEENVVCLRAKPDFVRVLGDAYARKLAPHDIPDFEEQFKRPENKEPPLLGVESVDKLAASIQGLIDPLRSVRVEKTAALLELLKVSADLYHLVSRVAYLDECRPLYNKLDYKKKLNGGLSDAEQWSLDILKGLLFSKEGSLASAKHAAGLRYSISVRDAVEHVLLNSHQTAENLERIKRLLAFESCSQDAPTWMGEMTAYLPPKREDASLAVSLKQMIGSGFFRKGSEDVLAEQVDLSFSGCRDL